MKGLILAAGRGTRLWPMTHSGAKQLIPVANRPILFHALDKLSAAGLRQVIVVISPETGAEIRSAIGDGARWGTRVDYVLQERPLGVAHAVLCAREALGGEAFCAYLGDNLLGCSIRETVERFRFRPEVDASLLLKEVADPRRFGVAEVAPDNRVACVTEKPRSPSSGLAVVGVYLFRPTIFDAIDVIACSSRGELEISDAITSLIKRGGEVRFERVASWWFDVASTEDLLQANTKCLDETLVGGVCGSVDAASALLGTVRIEAGASVVRSVVVGPSVIGVGARVVDSTVGPHASLGDGTLVERSTVVGSLIMAASTVTNVLRLEGSLVGRRACVGPVRVATLRLVVGDDGRVEAY